MKLYFFISLLLYTTINISFVLTAPETYVNTGTSNQAPEKVNNSKTTENATNVVSTEGGKINVTSNIPHQGREHVLTPVSSTTVSAPTPKTVTATSLKQQSSTTFKNNTATTSLPKEAETIPVTEVVEALGDSRVKPRKGVFLNDSVEEEVKPKNPVTEKSTTVNISNSSTVSTTVVTQKSTTTASTTFTPRKPTITFGSDEEDLPPRGGNSRLFVGGKEISPKNSSSVSPPSSISGREQIVGNRHYVKGSDYVLPIVLTILAVPLLAIILTVVYKRGAEWWSHRHYRRMDFLIDGMYNN